MSLELAIAENTAALKELIAAITSRPGTLHTNAADFVANHNKPVAEETKVKADTAPETKAEVKKTEAATQEQAAAVDYNKDVKPKLISLAQSKGKEALVSLLGKYNVTKGDQLAADALPAVLAEVSELLAA